jgi:predicted nucleotidyltransferase
MGRHQPASDVDLTLRGPRLSHRDLLQLMEAINDLLLPWRVDLSLHADLNDDLGAQVGRVGMPLLSGMERKD